jgi:hypothetical protein
MSATKTATKTNIAADRADVLWRAADALGLAMRAIDEMGRDALDVIQGAPDECDAIVIQGDDLRRALRTVAMRLDRAVMVRNGKDD